MSQESQGKALVPPETTPLLELAAAALALADAAAAISDPDKIIDDCAEELRGSARQLIDSALDGSPRVLADAKALRARKDDLFNRLDFLKGTTVPLPEDLVEETIETLTGLISAICEYAVLHLAEEAFEEAVIVAQGLDVLRDALQRGEAVAMTDLRGGYASAVDLLMLGQ